MLWFRGASLQFSILNLDRIMSQTARVRSIEAIEDFKTALCRFGADAKAALDAVEMEVRRSFDWLNGQVQHWRKEVQRREQAVGVARVELNRRKISRIFGQQPDCTEQEEALREAQQRLRLAEAKVERCRRWEPVLRHAMGEYEGPSRQLASLLEMVLPKAVAILDQKTEALESYVLMAPPPGAVKQAPEQAGVGVAGVEAETEKGRNGETENEKTEEPAEETQP